jgi:nicotinate-nucleotide pyrophosphorylase (carboxylating)
MIMLKDNHIDFAGGITKAIEKTQQYLQFKGLNLPIEVETRNMEEVKEVIKIGKINRIMLDNFSPELLAEAITLIDKKFETEASGGITLANIQAYAASGVDFISVGALTHSAERIDLSMQVEN